MADIAKLDLYEILDVSPDATEKEIIKAYRKRALKCHPDKNPDNPKAAEQFHQLSKALEILTDAGAKAAYDKVLKARAAAKIRNKQLEGKRKKFKEDLEARERAAEDRKDLEKDIKIVPSHTLEEEIARLRKEGSKLLEEEQERLREELKKESENKEPEITEVSSPARLKLKWKAQKSDTTNGGYNKNKLLELFDKYGEVAALLVSGKKNGTAIIEFTSAHGAVLAEQNEFGDPNNPLTISWLSGKPEKTTHKTTTSTTTSGQHVSSADRGKDTTGPSSNDSQSFGAASSTDFESLVLMRMRQAEERKKLAQEMAEEDEKT